MNQPVIIRREPVLNRHKAITATRLIVHAPSSADAAAALNQLADVWPNARTVIVGLAGGTLPDEGLLAWTPPDNAMLEIPAEALSSKPALALIEQLSARQTPLALGNYVPGTAMPAEPSFRFIIADAIAYPMLENPPGLLLARNLPDTTSFDKAIKNGYSGATGWFFLHGVPIVDKLNASHSQIVRVLNLVRHNAEIKEIEEALKHDVTLSFKLLHYINSAGFGLSCEIQSFKHAVSILGYDKLNRWLSLLLLGAGKDPAAPALMQTAIARGRFMELAGQGFFSRAQLDNLFIAGTFSLLDILLGAKLESALEQMNLPEAINDALLRNEGIFAPFLQLAISCERDDVAALIAQAEALQLDTTILNHAQIEAQAFADSLQFD